MVYCFFSLQSGVRCFCFASHPENTFDKNSHFICWIVRVCAMMSPWASNMFALLCGFVGLRVLVESQGQTQQHSGWYWFNERRAVEVPLFSLLTPGRALHLDVYTNPSVCSPRSMCTYGLMDEEALLLLRPHLSGGHSVRAAQVPDSLRRTGLTTPRWVKDACCIIWALCQQTCVLLYQNRMDYVKFIVRCHSAVTWSEPPCQYQAGPPPAAIF